MVAFSARDVLQLIMAGRCSVSTERNAKVSVFSQAEFCLNAEMSLWVSSRFYPVARQFCFPSRCCARGVWGSGFRANMRFGLAPGLVAAVASFSRRRGSPAAGPHRRRPLSVVARVPALCPGCDSEG